MVASFVIEDIFVIVGSLVKNQCLGTASHFCVIDNFFATHVLSINLFLKFYFNNYDLKDFNVIPTCFCALVEVAKKVINQPLI
jgi:hypothetical protein